MALTHTDYENYLNKFLFSKDIHQVANALRIAEKIEYPISPLVVKHAFKVLQTYFDGLTTPGDWFTIPGTDTHIENFSSNALTLVPKQLELNPAQVSPSQRTQVLQAAFKYAMHKKSSYIFKQIWELYGAPESFVTQEIHLELKEYIATTETELKKKNGIPSRKEEAVAHAYSLTALVDPSILDDLARETVLANRSKRRDEVWGRILAAGHTPPSKFIAWYASAKNIGRPYLDNLALIEPTEEVGAPRTLTEKQRDLVRESYFEGDLRTPFAWFVSTRTGPVWAEQYRRRADHVAKHNAQMLLGRDSERCSQGLWLLGQLDEKRFNRYIVELALAELAHPQPNASLIQEAFEFVNESDHVFRQSESEKKSLLSRLADILSLIHI